MPPVAVFGSRSMIVRPHAVPVLGLFTSSVNVAEPPLVWLPDRFLQRQLVGPDDRHRRRRSRATRPLADGVVVDPAVDVRSGVRELQADDIRGRVLELHRNLDDDLLARRNVDADRGVLDHEARRRPGVDRRPRLRARDLRDADEAQVRGGGRQVVEDAHVVERRRIRRSRHGDAIREHFANGGGQLGVGLGQCSRRRQRHHDTRGVLVAHYGWISLAVDVGVVAQRKRGAVGETCRRLVGDDRPIDDVGGQPDIELDGYLTGGRHAQVADVDDARARARRCCSCC
jgi:hypothetical protein